MTMTKTSSWLLDANARNENALATRFVDAEHSMIRFVSSWGKWLAWDGRRWQLDDSEIRVTRLVRQWAHSLWAEAAELLPMLSKDELSSIHAFIRGLNRRASLSAIIALARSDARIAVHHDELNRAKHLLCVDNGTLNLQSRTLENHLPERLITQLAPVQFDPSASCPRWEEAMILIFGGDAELIRFVRQLLGYALHGDRGEHLLPVCYGSGANGKSFLWNTIVRLLGDYAGLANDSLLLGSRDSGHPTDKAFLYEKRFVPISEPEQNSKLREARVKELTGDATITARRMREDFWSFERTHLLWLSTNHLPKVSGSDEGIWRRIKLIPFTQDLRKVTSPIPDYDKLLADEEGSGILNWLLDGLEDYLMHGLQEPVQVAAAVGEYRDSEDELTLFVEECCEIGPSCTAESGALFDAYQRWGGKLNRTSFGRVMSERFSRRRTTNIRRRKVTVYDGISLSDEGSEIHEF